MSRRALARLTLCVFLFSWVVIALGAWTRLNNAGLSCPDWPFCYGHVFAPTRMGGSLYTVTQGWYEMVHRYLAGLLVLGLLVVSWGVYRFDKERCVPRWATVIMLLILLYQPWLGAMTVIHKLYPAIVSQHLLCGFALMSLLWWHYEALSEAPRLTLNKDIHFLPRLWVIALVSLSLQITLGVWTSTNNAAISCPYFPLCTLGSWHMAWLDAFNPLRQLGQFQHDVMLQEAVRQTIQVVHRFGALCVGIILFVAQGVMIVKRPSKSLLRLSCLSMALLLFQIMLGIMNAVYARPLLFAVAHTLTAAALLWTVVASLAIMLKHRVPRDVV